MLANFSGSVIVSEGRTVSVHPSTQIVRWIVACLTAGFKAPGVQAGSGRSYSPEPNAWQVPFAGCGSTTLLLAVE